MAEQERLYRTHILVLRRRDYGDADRILTVLMPDKGRRELIAKGVRKTTSRKAGHLELFSHAGVLVAQARTWDIITEAVTVESFRHLREDLDAIGRAANVAELVDAFATGDEDNRPLWDLALGTLEELDHDAAAPGRLDRAALLQWFTLHLLSLAGFQPQLFRCLSCDEELEPVTNFISLSEGGVFCPRCAPAHKDAEPVEVDVLKVLRFLQSNPWTRVRAVRVRPPIMRRVEQLLHRYLITVLERTVRSADFLRRLQNDPRLQ